MFLHISEGIPHVSVFADEWGCPAGWVFQWDRRVGGTRLAFHRCCHMPCPKCDTGFHSYLGLGEPPLPFILDNTTGVVFSLPDE